MYRIACRNRRRRVNAAHCRSRVRYERSSYWPLADWPCSLRRIEFQLFSSSLFSSVMLRKRRRESHRGDSRTPRCDIARRAMHAPIVPYRASVEVTICIVNRRSTDRSYNELGEFVIPYTCMINRGNCGARVNATPQYFASRVLTELII